MSEDWIREELTEYLPLHEVEELAQILMYRLTSERRKYGAVGFIMGVLIALLISGWL